MGYRIEYEGSREERFQWKRFAGLLGGALLLFCLLTQLFWPGGAQTLRELLIPGDPEVTARACETMVSGIRAGEDFGDTVTAFCREILDGAQDSD